MKPDTPPLDHRGNNNSTAGAPCRLRTPRRSTTRPGLRTAWTRGHRTAPRHSQRQTVESAPDETTDSTRWTEGRDRHRTLAARSNLSAGPMHHDAGLGQFQVRAQLERELVQSPVHTHTGMQTQRRRRQAYEPRQTNAARRDGCRARCVQRPGGTTLKEQAPTFGRDCRTAEGGRERHPTGPVTALVSSQQSAPRTA
jgi:hypothetical protein